MLNKIIFLKSPLTNISKTEFSLDKNMFQPIEKCKMKFDFSRDTYFLCPTVWSQKNFWNIGHWDVPRTFVECYINVSNIVCPLGFLKTHLYYFLQ